MRKEFSRTQMILGEEAMERLYGAHVAVFGVGGVGSYVVEALVRAGIGKLTIVDSDVVNITNINRQLIATMKTIGEKKVDVMKNRILDINPSAEVNAYSIFFTAETCGSIDFSEFDYVVDAIDTVTSKLLLVECARRFNTPIISSMGTGNKLDPTRLEVVDIYKTSVCPLAKVMRTELRKRGINSLTVLYSKEQPIKPVGFKDSDDSDLQTTVGSRHIPGSISFVPSSAGLIIASVVIRDLVGILK